MMTVLVQWLHASLEELGTQLVETRSRNLGVEIDTLVESVDLEVGLRAGRERALQALARGAQSADRALVRDEVVLVLALELLAKVLDQDVVNVLAAEMRVAAGGLDLEDAVVDRDHGAVERAAAKVVDQHVLLVAALVEAVRHGGRRRLVDDAQHVEAGDGAGVLGRHALRVAKVRRHRHDRVLDLEAEQVRRVLLELREHHGRDLLGKELGRLALERHLDRRAVAGLLHHLERPQQAVLLDDLVAPLTTNQALGVEPTYDHHGDHDDVRLGTAASINDETYTVFSGFIGAWL